jgi:hypothetical protein
MMGTPGVPKQHSVFRDEDSMLKGYTNRRTVGGIGENQASEIFQTRNSGARFPHVTPQGS